ncbi:hypothetical protein HMPREF1317_0982 [Schaalia georgiae F0490]|uniref:Uncharacterized protein n=1 Tax=Schaalia georgiae F0490 TaxID=1125717 RepID=J0NGM9_9ACTO|nr:hypothetical protein HMPREF1317_0982 [Schaalia georgiae F0490]
MGIRQPVFHGAPFRRRLTRRIRPLLCSRHHPRQGNALDDARGPGALRSGRRSPPGGGNRFRSGHGRSPRPRGALAGGNGALPMLRLTLGRRDGGNNTRIALRRPRRRRGRNSALPTPRLHHPLGRPLRRGRRLRGPGTPRRGRRAPRRPGRSDGNGTRITPRRPRRWRGRNSALPALG